MNKFSRRQFVVGAAAGAAALSFPIRRVLGANETVNMAFIGVGGRGTHSAKWFGEIPGVRVAAVCDADKGHMSACQKSLEAADIKDAKAIEDQRRIFDDKSIDAVCISSCSHWHALAAVWAIQSGKDVYVEKPVSNNVWEGRKIVEAARKYNKIVQGGTQQRSDPVQKQIKEFISSGKLGKMLWIRGNRLGRRESIGKRDTPLKPPADVNYDLWLGPAQDEPIYRPELHYDWHWVWNTGSGEMGNWGVHILDDIRMMLDDKSTLPKRILAAGGRVVWNDAGETPNVHIAYYDTGVVPVIFMLSNLPAKTGVTQEPQYRGIRSGYVIQFEGGYYAGGRGGGWAYDNDKKRIQQFKGDGGEAHAKNFIEAVRTRNRAIQNAEIEQTHYTSAWCHLANVAYRLGSPYGQKGAAELAKDFQPWSELLDQFHEHLEANGVDAAKAGLKLSSILEIDPQKEVFVGKSATPEAQALLRREYRKPYVMPDQV
jgi:predicted dehydrogenase